MEAFMKLEWCLLSWTAGGSAAEEGWPSFKAYIADCANASGSRYYEEELGNNNKGVFAYSCR